MPGIILLSRSAIIDAFLVEFLGLNVAVQSSFWDIKAD